MQKSLKMLTGVMAVLGRTLLCTVFLATAIGYTAPEVQELAQAVAARTALPTFWVFIGATVVLAAGVFSVVVGYKARCGASALLLFLLLSTCLLHGFTFWNVVSPQARHDHILLLVMNLSIMGAMLFIVANGAGQMSLDGKQR